MRDPTKQVWFQKQAVSVNNELIIPVRQIGLMEARNSKRERKQKRNNMRNNSSSRFRICLFVRLFALPPP